MTSSGNKLAAYLRKNKLSTRDFATKAGIPHLHPMVSMWARGRARPGLDLAFVIEEATGGEVPASYWRGMPSRSRSVA